MGKLLTTCFIILLTLTIVSAQPSSLTQDIAAYTDQSYQALFDLYKDLHAHPEISFQEKNTAAKIAAQLKSLGFEVTENFGGYGIVGILKNGTGPCVMVRTDLDGLPVEEKTNAPYASKTRTKDETGKDVPTMHACGHDVHMTVFTGVAKTMVQFKNRWKGTLLMIGQPAEERSGGAKAMLQQGLFTKFPKPDYALALHMNAFLAAGKVGYTEGGIMASVDAVDITVRGIGGHGAIPQNTKDPIVLASQIVIALQTIVSREISPFEPAVVTVGSIQGGTQYNIIPDEVKLQLTLRSYSDAVRNQTIAAINRICKGIAEAAGVSQDRLPIVTIRDQYTPPTINDIPLTRRLTNIFAETIGKENVVDTPASMVGEDFSFYSRQEAKIPTCMFWLGAVDPEQIDKNRKNNQELPSLHSGLFLPLPEPAIKTGIKAMSAAVLELMHKR
ncbi:amidohydrolase [Rhodocytophaga rosea]|uniref:Amidohydrolase n=1 Tax=Rhodocytophaga rosea TaxID=2704465 RepID=A0A6C0GHK8_9BACT|nr:amidohydrolase [Rhodocytophaga rosea]QHT67172.1 amidohydrolase [Rhodocytophaga rosea]